MQISWRDLWRISRPRCWMYLFGSYLLGALAGAREPADLARPLALVFAVFFLGPANLLIHGVHDLFTADNNRRDSGEPNSAAPLQPDFRQPAARLLWLRVLMAATLPFLLFLPLTPGAASLSMLAFLFFALEYSAPPIHAQSKPLLDAAFRIAYVCPGLFGYFLLGGHNMDWQIVAAASLWTMALHTYAAAQDISTDRAVGLNTISTQLGWHGAVGLGLALCLAAAVLALPLLGALAAALGVLYAALMFASLTARTQEQRRAPYRWFPLLNVLSGLALCGLVVELKWW
jgi:4-hydroxybenzoate polyprenyltransferase